MGTKFSTFLKEIEDEARAEGPEAVEQLETLGAHFRMGRKLAEARRAQHLTQKQVAQRAKVDQAQISDMERGAANPTFTTLSAVALAVGMEVDLKRRRAR
jgi:DNA-binding XRE family transcriptional regulator